jgi:hypothetical protein
MTSSMSLAPVSKPFSRLRTLSSVSPGTGVTGLEWTRSGGWRLSGMVAKHEPEHCLFAGNGAFVSPWDVFGLALCIFAITRPNLRSSDKFQIFPSWALIILMSARVAIWTSSAGDKHRRDGKDAREHGYPFSLPPKTAN